MPDACFSLYMLAESHAFALAPIEKLIADLGISGRPISDGRHPVPEAEK